jgi:hypothetical protein
MQSISMQLRVREGYFLVTVSGRKIASVEPDFELDNRPTLQGVSMWYAHRELVATSPGCITHMLRASLKEVYSHYPLFCKGRSAHMISSRLVYVTQRGTKGSRHLNIAKSMHSCFHGPDYFFHPTSRPS